MKRLAAVLSVLAATTAPAAAQPLVCFGNEPSWGVEFGPSDRARVSAPGVSPVEYLGKETPNELLRERLWRGRAATGGDLVVFLRDAACSDGMSDTTHPVIARLSMPDGAFLAGCCRAPAAQTPATPLEGTSWRLVNLPGHAPAALAGLKRGLSARFEAGRITGFAGCNAFTGPYTLKEDRLTVGVLAGTMMACPDPAMSIERAFHTAFTGTFSWAITGDRLTLTGGSGAPLTFEKEAAATLEGGSWEVTGFNNGRQAVVSPMANTALSIAFANGTATGQAGCNTFRATYSSTGPDSISIGPVATTRKMCDDAVMAQERQFLKALESATTWKFDGAMLHLHRADGERVLVGPRRP